MIRVHDKIGIVYVYVMIHEAPSTQNLGESRERAARQAVSARPVFLTRHTTAQRVKISFILVKCTSKEGRLLPVTAARLPPLPLVSPQLALIPYLIPPDTYTVKLLLKHGAAVHGNDCLYLACKSGQVEAVELFVRAGCDTSEPVADVKMFRNTPFLSQHIGQTGTGREIAEQCGHTAVLAVLDAREAEAQAKAEAKAAKKRAQNKKKAQRRKEVKKQAAAAAAATEAVAAAEAEATVPSAAA